MSLGVRGSNPIWVMVNLTGQLFDDTYYMWVLENDIPYIPATVYHDPDLNTPWTNPIQFLGNGTLPDNIYFENDVTYRLEFRQHIGIGTPTQNDPLIYLIENYQPGANGVSPIDSVAITSDNQVTNPQFALIDFVSPYSFTGTNPPPLHIGPGWYLEVSGSGSYTVSQVPLNNSNQNPSNAPYALRITLSGWTNNSVFLRQRFYQNGMLWANKTVSSAITAQINGAPQFISASLIDSNSATLGLVLPSQAINQMWNEYTGYAVLPATTNPNDPPAAYIDYLLALPSNIDIYVTSIQLVVQNTPIEPSFIQDSINRQIDYTYHDAYPIVPVGMILPFGGFGPVAHFILCDGSTYNRTQYSQLFNTITATELVNLTNGVATFTVASGSKYCVGMGLEGTGIDVYTTITGISGNTITMSSNATATGSNTVRFFAAAPTFLETVILSSGNATFTVSGSTVGNYHAKMAITGLGIPSGTVVNSVIGTTITMSNNASANGASVVTFYGVGNGDTTTTFNVYNLQGYVIAGTGGSLLAPVANSGLGGSTGYPTHIMTIAELATHTHGIYGTNGAGTTGGVAGTGLATPVNLTGTSASAGSNTPFTIVQPTKFFNYYIRYE